MGFILEPRRRQFELPAAFDINLLVGVDQNVGYGFVLEQRLDGPEANHLMHDVVDKDVEFTGIEGDAFGVHMLGDQIVYLGAQLALGNLVDDGKIEFVDQPAMNAEFCVEQALLQGIFISLGLGR